MADLSPQAQAVYDAYTNTFRMRLFTDNRSDALAAAIRALAKVTCEPDPIMGWKSAKECRILAIAYELEQAP